MIQYINWLWVILQSGNNCKNKEWRTNGKILFTSESVTEGHPDKICDAISDAILDALIAQDPMSRVACETATTTGLVLVMGEITSKANIDIQSIVRETIREIGYTRGKFGFDADTCAVITALDKQSADIAMGVDKALEQKENQMDEDELDLLELVTRVSSLVMLPTRQKNTCHTPSTWHTNFPVSLQKSVKMAL